MKKTIILNRKTKPSKTIILTKKTPVSRRIKGKLA